MDPPVGSSALAALARLWSDLLEGKDPLILEGCMKNSSLSSVLTLVEAKVIVRHYKENVPGFAYLSLYRNKPELMESLNDVVRKQTFVAVAAIATSSKLPAPPQRTVTAPAPIAARPFPLPIAPAAAPRAAPIPAPAPIAPRPYPLPIALIAAPRPAPIPVPAAASLTFGSLRYQGSSAVTAAAPQSVLGPSPSFPPSLPRPPLPTYVAPPPSKSQAQLHKHLTILTTAKKKSVFMQLVMQSGVSEQDALDAIQASEDPELDVEQLIMDVVMQKEEQQAEIKHQQALKLQEDKDLDAAIANSEGEREEVQKRKRKRVEELRDKCNEELWLVEEFKNSLLLKASINGSSSSSSSSSSILTAACIALDNKCCALYSGSCTCSEQLKDMRRRVVSLLLLEQQAMKFHREASHRYLIELGLRLEMLRDSGKNGHNNGTSSARVIVLIDSPHESDGNGWSSILSSGGSSSSSSSSSSSGSSSSSDSTCQHSIFCCGITWSALSRALDSETADLENALYRPPKDGGMIPVAFRVGMPSASLEADGVELVGGSAKEDKDNDEEDDDDDEMVGYNSEEENFPW